MSTPSTPAPELERPHAYLAAADLLQSLLAQPELAPYVMPEPWKRNNQHPTIAALARSHGVAVAVGLGDTTLPAAGRAQQGGYIRIGLALYVFQPDAGKSLLQPDAELRHRVWLTCLKYANAWSYQLTPTRTIKAILSSIAEVDLSAVNKDFAAHTTAEALLLEIPLQLTI